MAISTFLNRLRRRRIAIILGVPRSGTTLLRVLLGSHSAIFGASETPWITGAYGTGASLREFVNRLCDADDGPVRNGKGITHAHIYYAAQTFLLQIYTVPMQTKRVLVLKTPDDLQFLDDLFRMFPEALYIHLRRDPRDVALSTTSHGAWQEINWYGANTFANAISRWCEWEEKIAGSALFGSMCHITYERLLTHPDDTLRTVCRFLRLPYQPSMKDYAHVAHDVPTWEAGSQDVVRHGILNTARVFPHSMISPTAEHQKAVEQYAHRIERLGYKPSWQ